MRIFAASLATETNTFAIIPTGMASFEQYGVYRGDGSKKDPEGVGANIRDIRFFAEADGYEVIEGLSAWAQPAGRTLRKTYETLRDALLEDLKAALPVDVVQLFLHGAMVAEGYDDCEGDILERVRAIVGPHVPVGAELDLHCHLTEKMKVSADVLVAFKEYPHIDARARAGELYRILIESAKGQVRPVTAVFDCKMVGFYHTTREPMASFVRRMQSLEGHNGVLTVSLAHGFPWGDVPDNSAKVWVVTDNDPELAGRLARQLGLEFWALRDQTGINKLPIDSAIDRALESSGPTVFSDMADNPGGGASGDSTFILKRLIERDVRDAVVGGIWDLGAVHICRAAGVGTKLNLRIGGKCGPESGAPVDVPVTVRAIRDNYSQHSPDGRSALGTGVWVETDGGIHILLISIRNQILSRDAFTGLGLRLDDKRIISVKSAQHFVADFQHLTKEVIYVSSPGAVNPDFGAITFTKRSPDYWPRVNQPQGIR